MASRNEDDSVSGLQWPPNWRPKLRLSGCTPQAQPPQEPLNPFVWQGTSQPESEQLMQDLLGALNTMPVILGGGGGLVSQGSMYELPGKRHF